MPARVVLRSSTAPSGSASSRIYPRSMIAIRVLGADGGDGLTLQSASVQRGTAAETETHLHANRKRVNSARMRATKFHVQL